MTGDFVTSAVGACVALCEAREARSKEVDALLRKHDRRVEALRGTRIDQISTDDPDGMNGSGAGPASAALVAAEKGLREVDSAAAFELEQELWRGGLRGEALQERLKAELSSLRVEWLAHKARAVECSVAAARSLAAKRASLAGAWRGLDLFTCWSFPAAFARHAFVLVVRCIARVAFRSIRGGVGPQCGCARALKARRHRYSRWWRAHDDCASRAAPARHSDYAKSERCQVCVRRWGDKRG